jgi:hypothetical protein
MTRQYPDQYIPAHFLARAASAARAASFKSLFKRLRDLNPPVELIRETVAGAMTADEIHEDVHKLFAKLRGVVRESGSPDITL